MAFDVKQLLEQTAAQAAGALAARPQDLGKQAAMQYPKLLPVMKFRLAQYKAADYGTLMTMHTVGMGGMMELATLVFTPGSGKAVPFLLVDIMAMKNKRTVFVEFYDCTAQGAADTAALEALAQRSRDIPDYAEKPAWYVGERTAYSLIKGGEPVWDDRLTDMVRQAVDAYLAMCQHASAAPANRIGLQNFQTRMVNEGNPASPVLEKLFGKQGAADFFRNVIMPV